MKRLLFLFFCLSCSLFLHAKDNKDSVAIILQKYIKLVDSVNKAMKYQTGLVKLKGNVAELKVPPGFKYLNVEQSKYVVEDLWGNLPQDNLEGMLFPADSNPFDDSSYAFIITYKPMGYVKDDDAESIDYDDLMKQMQKDEVEENKRRKEIGATSLHTVGWASKPYYDKQHKVLHWAINLHPDGADENTLNYKVILLGRKGILVMNAVAPLSALDSVKADMAAVVAIPHFASGNRYDDFNPDVDKIAAWTVGGLVAGKILASTGFFALIGKFLIAAWKFILLGFAGLAAGVKKLFNRKKESMG